MAEYKNMTIVREKDELVIRINIGKAALSKATLSNSGKTRLVATTSGLQGVENPPIPGMKVAVNCIIPKDDE